ncbi:hypothetical protein W02_41990 [Nitrospira sp. KM1]|uniref:DUF4282 domain-containing protein n=1 Tax=Nitrospira sp. KM1 TaxID=1936990 RepID=UPI0013A75EAF|nr:DUF4282 domain-containing protein [Nitrospira sp. KM1]BCA57059.1 hypothetical protein W02_41990 [Nitrospira sp. KM1]
MKRRPSAPRHDSIAEYFTFRHMVAPFWIRSAYVLGLITITGASMAAMLLPYMVTYSEHDHMLVRIGSMVVLVVGNILWRILCEMVIVLFRMHMLLERLDDRARWLAGVDTFDN